MIPKAILFDVGLTLVHPSGVTLAQVVLEQAEIVISPREALRALVLAAEARRYSLPKAKSGDEKVWRHWAYLVGAPLYGASFKAVFETLTELSNKAALYVEVDPQAHTVLGALQAAGHTLIAVSNSDGRVMEELQGLGLDVYFHAVVDSALVGIEKPDPKIFQYALKCAGVSPRQAWMVGDGMINDIAGGVHAGLGDCLLYDPYDAYASVPYAGRIRTLQKVLGRLGYASPVRDATAFDTNVLHEQPPE